MKYEVTVFDRDYRCLVERYYIDFVNEDEAKRYCENNSWTGEDYFAKKVETKQDVSEPEEPVDIISFLADLE